MELVQMIIIGISLSMDAFSLSLVYGTLNLEKKMLRFLSVVVGIFHFFMPLLGSMIGEFVVHNFIPEPNKLVGIIFIILSIQMLLNIKELETTKATMKSIAQAFLFGFSVSLDSFSVGIGLGARGENMVLCGLVFSLCSAVFTYSGLNLGKKLTLKFGKIANIVGSLMLLILGIEYFFAI